MIHIRTSAETSKKYYCNEFYFNKIDHPEKAYWLGFLIADGYIESKRKYGNQKFGITLAEKDMIHLQKFNNCLDSTYPLLKYIGSGYNPNGIYVKLLITSQQIVNDLKKYGICEQKTKICKIPPNIPVKYMKDFIRGYIDGDGSIYIDTTTNQLRLSITGTYNLLYGINQFLGTNNKISFVKNDIYELKFGGNKKCLEIFEQLYYKDCLCLERKYKIISFHLK